MCLGGWRVCVCAHVLGPWDNPPQHILFFVLLFIYLFLLQKHSVNPQCQHRRVLRRGRNECVLCLCHSSFVAADPMILAAAL